MLITEQVQQSKPLFITFEGGEGCGKTTQIKMLVKTLETAGAQVVHTHEPGGSPEGKTLRSMLVEGDPDRWDGLSELLLYSTERNEHLRQVIMPSLAAGKWVVSDRFADSTRVYQSNRGVPVETVQRVNDLVVGNRWPQLTLLLDIPVEVGLKRSLAINTHENRFESLGTEFHEKIRQGYLDIAKEHSDRCVIIDASGTIEEVHTAILDAVVSYLKEKAA